MKEGSGKARKELWRFVKFALFSASAGLIQAGIFYLLKLIPSLNWWACYLPALVASVVWNLTLNRRFTFQSAANIPMAVLKTLGYYAVFTPVSTILGDWLVEVRFPDVFAIANIVLFSMMLVNFVTEFLFQRYYVFRGKMDNRAERPAGQRE